MPAPKVLDETRINIRYPDNTINYLREFYKDDDEKFQKAKRYIQYQHALNKDKFDAEDKIYTADPKNRDNYKLKSAIDNHEDLEFYDTKNITNKKDVDDFQQRINNLYLNRDNSEFGFKCNVDQYNKIINFLGGEKKAKEDGFKVYNTKYDGKLSSKIITCPKEFSYMSTALIDAVTNLGKYKKNENGFSRGYVNYNPETNSFEIPNAYQLSVRDAVNKVNNFREKLNNKLLKFDDKETTILTDMIGYSYTDPYEMLIDDYIAAYPTSKNVDKLRKLKEDNIKNIQNLFKNDINLNAENVNLKMLNDNGYFVDIDSDKANEVMQQIKRIMNDDNSSNDVKVTCSLDCYTGKLQPTLSYNVKLNDGNIKTITVTGDMFQDKSIMQANTSIRNAAIGSTCRAKDFNDNLTIGFYETGNGDLVNYQLQYDKDNQGFKFLKNGIVDNEKPIISYDDATKLREDFLNLLNDRDEINSPDYDNTNINPNHKMHMQQLSYDMKMLYDYTDADIANIINSILNY